MPKKPNGFQKQVQRLTKVVELIEKLGQADSWIIRSTLGYGVGTYNQLSNDLKRLYPERVEYDDTEHIWKSKTPPVAVEQTA